MLLADDGRVVLTDFGIATLETETALTMTGIAGTPAFNPPERNKGGSAQRESDLWSLGATLYAAVEGRPPHDRGGALPTMHAILNDEPATPAHAGRLAPVLEGLLRKDPALRMNYDEAERLLRVVAEGEDGAQAARQDGRHARRERLGRDRSGNPVPGRGLPRHRGEAGRRRTVLLEASGLSPALATGRTAGARREGGGRGGTAEAHLRGEAETPAPPPARPEATAPVRSRPPRRCGETPFPRPGRSPFRRHGGLPGPGRTPSLPYGSPSRPHGPNPSPAPPGSPPPDPQDGMGTQDPSSQLTMASQGGSRTPMKRGLLVVLPALLVVGVIAGWLGMRSGQDGGEQTTGSSQARPNGSSGPAGSGGSTGPAETTPESTPEQKPSPSPSPSPTKTEKKEESTLPAGWHLHKDSDGFSVGLPKGWYVESRESKTVRFRGRTTR